MAIGADSLGLLFKIRSDSKDARDDIKSLSETITKETDSIKSKGAAAFTKLGESVGISSASMSKMAAALPLVGAGIAAVAGAAIGAGVAIFGLAKNAADAGSQIYDLSQRTGASVETLSALRLVAQQSGTSLEDFAGGVSKFNRLIGEAAKGSDEATEKLKRFGIEPREALQNQEAALAKVFKVINDLPPGLQRSIAAQDAFGKSGDKLVDLIQSVGGNLEDFIEQARAAGFVMSGEAAAAADKFGDTLDELKFKAGEAARTIGEAMVPAITRAMERASEAFTKHQGVVAAVAESIGVYLEQEIDKIDRLVSAIERFYTGFRQQGLGLGAALALFGTTDGPAQGTQTVDFGNAVRDPRLAGGVSDFFNEKAKKEKKAGKSDAEKEAERQAGVLKNLQKELDELTLRTRIFNESASSQETKLLALSQGYTTLTEANRRLADELLKNINQTKEELAAQEKAKDEAKERLERRKQAAESLLDELARQRNLFAEQKTELEKVNALITDAQAAGFLSRRTEELLRQVAAMNDLIAATERRNRDPFFKLGDLQPGDASVGAGVTAAAGPSAANLNLPAPGFLAEFRRELATTQDFTQTFGGVIGDTFGRITEGIGAAAGAWLAYGQSFGQAIKAVLQQALGAIAVEAAVQAIKETALGFAKLAGFLPGPAALHFKSAALWGVAAVAAGGAARAFSGGGGSAGVSSAVGSGGGGSSFSNQSSARDRTIREARAGGSADPNQPQAIQVYLNVKTDGGAIVEHVKTDYRRGGGFRELLRGDILREATA